MPRPSSLLSAALGLVALGLGVYAWQLHERLETAEAALAAKAKTEKIPRPAPAAESAPLPIPARASAETADAAVPASGPAGSPGPRRGGDFGGFRNTPEMQRLMTLQRKAALDGRYAALFKKLNLSPADLDKLKTLLAQKEATAMDVFMSARNEGLSPRDNRDQIQKLISDLESEADSSIRGLIGETGFQQYQQYEQTMPQRGVVNQLEQRLSYSDSPLYGNQVDQLVNVLAANSPARAGGAAGATGFPGGPFGGGRGVPITDSVIAQSQSFLSATQVDALRQIQQEQAAQAALRQQMQQNRRAAAGPGGP